MLRVVSFFGKLFATVHSVGEHIAKAMVAGESGPFERLAWLKSDLARLDALAVASRALSFDERYTDAHFVLEHAATIQPLGLIERRIDLARMRQRPEEELELVRLAAAEWPRDTNWQARLADILVEFDDLAGALQVLEESPEQDRILDTTRARVLTELGRYEEARGLAQELAVYWEEIARGSMIEGSSMEAAHHHGRCLDILERITELQEGLGARVLATAAAGRIDRHAAHNYTLIGAALMDEGQGASTEPLRLPDEAAAEDASRRAPRSVRALCSVGIVALRQGAFERAQGRFRKAHDQDVKHFPAALGLGAAMRLEQGDALRGLDLLPELGTIAGLEALVPAWGALTPEERRVVHASAHPLRSVVPRLVEAGARIHVLPLDGRPQDVLVGEGAVGFARIEDLLDTVSEHDAWRFAFALAEIAAPELPTSVRSELAEVHRRATDVEWAVGAWAQLDVEALFATGYRGWLQRRYGGKWAPKRDGEGIVEQLERAIGRLANED